jgi:hypothetical protein
MKKIFLVFIIAIIYLAACAPTNAQIRAAIAKTEAVASAAFTATAPAKLIPTQTQVPTRTNTPEPTNTPQSTATTAPTSTPTTAPSPTPPPQPIELSGNGSQVVEFDNPFGAAFIRAVYTGSRNFIVHNVGADNENIDLLINTSGKYDGFRPLDWSSNEHTMRFTVKSYGDWKITVYPIAKEYLHSCEVPCEYPGQGDDIVLLTGGKPDMLEYNFSGERNAVLKAIYEGTYDLLVNDSAPVKGSALLPGGTRILEIRATGPWIIKISSR